MCKEVNWSGSGGGMGYDNQAGDVNFIRQNGIVRMVYSEQNNDTTIAGNIVITDPARYPIKIPGQNSNKAQEYTAVNVAISTPSITSGAAYTNNSDGMQSIYVVSTGVTWTSISLRSASVSTSAGQYLLAAGDSITFTWSAGTPTFKLQQLS
jgi:hypothetical protein